LPARQASLVEAAVAERGKQAAEHAKRDHGVTQIDAATLAKVKAAIRTA
jgi:predicted small metal-binding protein